MNWAEFISSFTFLYFSELGPAHSWAGPFSFNSVISRRPLDCAEISAEFLFKCSNALGPLDLIEMRIE
jgi:hypothetical protein